MNEFRRILKLGGVLLFTTMGSQFLHRLNDAERNKYDHGEVIVVPTADEGSNWYGTFQSCEHVKLKLLDHFDMLEYVPGGEIDILGGAIKQDIYIL